MNSAYRLDFSVPRSGSEQFTLLAEDVGKNPVDLTGVSVAIEIFKQSGDTIPILKAGGAFDDSVTGMVWTDAATGQMLFTYYGSALASVDGQYEVVRLSHKIRLSKTGDPPLLIYGTLELLPE